MPPPSVKRCGVAEHYRRVYLVAPRHPESFWSLQGTVDLVGAKTFVPNSALATLIALTPSDVAVEFVLGDENVSPIGLDLPCDLVAITGATLHASRIVELCSAFRERGVPVALGGTYATLQHDRCLGLIMGFDGDDSTVFDEMYAFIHDTASPIVGISMLNAPRHTPLYERLSREGRLVGSDFSGEWQLETNIVPKQMTREELTRGYV